MIAGSLKLFGSKGSIGGAAAEFADAVVDGETVLLSLFTARLLLGYCPVKNEPTADGGARGWLAAFRFAVDV